jgi:hypothetical protein
MAVTRKQFLKTAAAAPLGRCGEMRGRLFAWYDPAKNPYKQKADR